MRSLQIYQPGLPFQAPTPSPHYPSRSIPISQSQFCLILQRLIYHPLQPARCFLRPGVRSPSSPPTPGPIRPSLVLASESPHQHDHSPSAEDDAAGGQLGPTAQKRRHEGSQEWFSYGPSGKVVRVSPGCAVQRKASLSQGLAPRKTERPEGGRGGVTSRPNHRAGGAKRRTLGDSGFYRDFGRKRQCLKPENPLLSLLLIRVAGTPVLQKQGPPASWLPLSRLEWEKPVCHMTNFGRSRDEEQGGS